MSYQAKVSRLQGADKVTVFEGGTLEVQTGGNITGNPIVHCAKSRIFDIDNGSGVTIDDVIMRPPAAITIVAARVVYVTETTANPLGGNIRLGTSAGSQAYVASTVYEAGKPVGSYTNLVLTLAQVAANSSIHCRHTGTSATRAGEAQVEIYYTYD